MGEDFNYAKLQAILSGGFDFDITADGLHVVGLDEIWIRTKQTFATVLDMICSGDDSKAKWTVIHYRT